MKVLLGLLLGVGALVVVGGAMAVFRIDPPNCRLFSVDEDAWVAANQELLDELPAYRTSTLMYESSNGSAFARDRCLGFENSGPYDSYATFRRYDMPAGSKFAGVAAFYGEYLRGEGWSPYLRVGSLEVSYTRGDECLALRSAQGEMFFELVANHDRG